MAARPGFEPRQTEPESVVLPLHHRADYGINIPTIFNFSSGKVKKNQKKLKL